VRRSNERKNTRSRKCACVKVEQIDLLESYRNNCLRKRIARWIGGLGGGRERERERQGSMNSKKAHGNMRRPLVDLFPVKINPSEQLGKPEM
jgi:hypothetical protein